MDRRLCLITGASAGIGAEFARQYAALGWDVALTARRKDRLEELATEIESKYGVHAICIVQDLARANSADKILSTLLEQDRHVDALVNNAGYGLPGTFFNTSWKSQAEFLRVLYTAPIELAHKVLPGMSDRGYGRIINVASLAGYAPGSNGHTLYASVKAGLTKFSESLNAECEALEGADIHCTALCPGFTYSEFHDVNGTREQMKSMNKRMWMEAGPVVKAGIDAVNRGQPVVVPGVVNKGLATLTRLMPEPLGRAIMRRQSRTIRRQD
ncbi:MAG: dehydrogenase [Hyphomonas sp.]|uniref:SDR family NAD(P)-dependent oxidoreductase n=1 Tax=unclassified Hyphomonas TaxID=2630699 RepID=UPI000B70CE95|nr:SDR family oxidoreductase [Hyphomonas sp.]MAH93456.1 dehydrogenase [Hyphomonas sp.]OUX85193.1 MAG: dehydrogenase [Hyphomonas sp. TMED31]